MDHHLGYDSNDKGTKKSENRQNGYGNKTLKTSYGEVDIEVSRNKDTTFESVIVP